VGAYTRIVMRAPEIAERALPGQFVAIAVGGEPTAMLLRRCFSLHRAAAGEIEVVVSAHGPGTRWLVARRASDAVDVVGPLGEPFPTPEPGARAVLVGGGYGSAPLAWFAESLARAGTAVDAVVGASSESKLFGVEEFSAACDGVMVTTEDGSSGERGRVTDLLPPLLSAGSTHVYACGPMPMLWAVHEVAAAAGAASSSAVEEAMACGIGVCMTCVLPVRDEDGATRMVRSCTAGPVFDGYRVRWDDVGTIPTDAVGAGHH
jgi:dihydroorotate dehydrogenase electron transfer subunit